MTQNPSLGLVLPFDSALDREYWQYLPEGVDLFVARTPHVVGPLGVDLMAAVADPEVILGVAGDMATALAPDAVVYACTSGSFLRGLDACLRLTADMVGRGCKRAGSTSEFLLAALRHLGIERLAVGTPYDDALTGLLVEFLNEGGVEPVSVSNLGMTGDPKNVDAEGVRVLARQSDAPEAEAVFLSCTNLRTFEHIGRLETELGKPVLTANQVTMWGALALAGLPQPSLDHRLFA